MKQKITENYIGGLINTPSRPYIPAPTPDIPGLEGTFTNDPSTLIQLFGHDPFSNEPEPLSLSFAMTIDEICTGERAFHEGSRTNATKVISCQPNLIGSQDPSYARTCFLGIEDISRDDQRTILKMLPLMPSMIVSHLTGIYFYWLLAKRLQLVEWQGVQRGAYAFFDLPPVEEIDFYGLIPGFDYIRHDSDYRLTYDRVELDLCLPTLTYTAEEIIEKFGWAEPINAYDEARCK